MIVTPHNCSRFVTTELSTPFGGGNFSFNVGMSFDDDPRKAAATPAAPLVQVPICSVANHTRSAAGFKRSSLTRKPNAIINTPLAVNSMCAITMPRNHATADGGINPTAQPTVIWRTPRNRVQRLRFAFKLSVSIVIRSTKGGVLQKTYPQKSLNYISNAVNKSLWQTRRNTPFSHYRVICCN